MRSHIVLVKGFRIVQCRHKRLVAHFFHQNHGGVLVQRLVHGRHLAHFHEHLDDFGRLDRHLVCQFGHRDGFRNVHFNGACLDRRCMRMVIAAPVIAVIATAATAAPGATAPCVATVGTARVTTGGNAFFLGWIACPAGGQLGRLDFLASTGRRRSRAGRTRTRRTGGLVQRALLGVARDSAYHRLGLFGLLGHQHLGRCGQHGTDGCSFGLGLATALTEVGGAGRFFLGTGTRFGFCLFARFGLGGNTRCHFGLVLARCLFLQGRDLRLLVGFLGRVRSSAFGCFTFALFIGFAFCALGSELLLLATDHFRLTECSFLAPHQFRIGLNRRGFDHRSGCRHFSPGNGRRSNSSRHGHVAVIALDEGALLAHFDLDGAGLAGGIGLLDFTGGLFHQRDFFPVVNRHAMAGLQMRQQFLLVGLGQCIGGRTLGDTGRLELFKQCFGGFLEFAGELGDSNTGHMWFVPP